MAGLETIPALIREIADEATLALALIENIQREDLNPLEEAVALRRLIDEFDLTHEQAATSVGRSRAAVSNLLRLLDLAPEVRALVEQQLLDMGHARALLSLDRDEQGRVAHEGGDKGLSVRQVEVLVRRLREGEAPSGRAPATKSADIRKLEEELSETLCAPVSLRHSSSGKGQLTIRYTSLDELDGLLERFRRRTRRCCGQLVLPNGNGACYNSGDLSPPNDARGVAVAFCRPRVGFVFWRQAAG